MKKLSFLSLLLICGVASYAQPYFTAFTNSPTSAFWFVKHNCNVASITHPPVMNDSFPAATWDYTSLTEISTDTLKYLDPLSGSVSDSFPGCNLYSEEAISGNVYAYYCDTNSYKIIGSKIGSEFRHYTHGPSTVLNYPFAWHNILLGVVNFNTLGATPHKQTSYDSSICNGWGNLILPIGTFSNSLLKTTRSFIIDTSTTGTVTTLYRMTCDWFAPAYKNQVMTIVFDSSITGSTSVNSVAYYSLISINVNNVSAPYPTLKISPIPAENNIEIKLGLNDNENAQLIITDITGKIYDVIAETEIKNNIVKYSVASLPNGMYFLNLKAPTGNVVEKFIVNK